MIDQTPPEIFSQRPAHMEFVQEQHSRAELARLRSYRNRRIITCVVLVVLIMGGGYEIYSWNGAPKEIPTIEADGALKQKPEQPGGLDVPNQDVLAYQQLDNSSAKPQAEHLLPPPEQPQAQAAAPAANKPPATTFPMAPKVENFEAPAMDALAPAPVTQQIDKTPAPAPTAAPPAPAKSEAVEVTPLPTTPDQGDEAQAAPAKSDTSAAKSAGGKKNVRIQMASFPDEEEASRQLGRMQEKFASELGDAKLHLAKADLGSRGIYYRVQSNPISGDDARDICTALKKLKAGCIIVKP